MRLRLPVPIVRLGPRPYADHFGLELSREKIEAEALEWAMTRANRSGRTVWQFIQDLAGRLGKATL